MAANYPRPRWYTVMLLRPDHVTDNYGTDTWFEAVKARTPQEAVETAQKLCVEVDGEEDVPPEDYICLCCIRGKHNDINNTW